MKFFQAPAIVVFTINGDIARFVSKFRPAAYIFAVRYKNYFYFNN